MQNISNKLKFISLTLLLGILLVGCGGGGSSTGEDSPSDGGSSPSGYDIEKNGIPKFVEYNYIDLSEIEIISKFRSGEGHDYSDDFESCRSMKHYFKLPDSSTSIYSPIDGVVSKAEEGWAGTQLHIKSNKYPDFTFIIFHVNLFNALKNGDQLSKGQSLGTHIGEQTYSDIAVGVNTIKILPHRGRY